MHYNNKVWLRILKDKYPENFVKAKVLELGSLNWCGGIREFFEQCEYYGVDQLPGQDVDIVCDAKKTKFTPEYFDTLAIFSLFEHDLHWRKTLKHNLQWLKKGGRVFTCFGAEDNEPHLVDSVGWKLVPNKTFVNYCKKLGLEVIDAFFEEERYGPGCKGAFDVEAIK